MQGKMHDILVDSPLDLVGVKVYRLAHPSGLVQCSSDTNIDIGVTYIEGYMGHANLDT